MLTPPSAAAILHIARAHRGARGSRPASGRIAVPAASQESVWDFPRPPLVQTVTKRIRVEFAGSTIADSTQALRVIETAGAPCYYIPPRDCKLEALTRTGLWTICEWKGLAYAYGVAVNGRSVEQGAWSYPEPLTDLAVGYERIAGYFAFYPSPMDACYVGGERATPQPGGYYGGWVTAGLTGPIKGEPGSDGW